MTTVFDFAPAANPLSPNTASQYGYFQLNGSDGTVSTLSIGHDPGTADPGPPLGNFVIGAPAGLDFVVGPDTPDYPPTPDARKGSFVYRPGSGTIILAAQATGFVSLQAPTLRFVRNPYAEFADADHPDWLSPLSHSRLNAVGADLKVTAWAQTGAEGSATLTCTAQSMGFMSAGGSIRLNPWPSKFGTTPMELKANGDLEMHANVSVVGMVQLESFAGVKLPIYAPGSFPVTILDAPQGSMAFLVKTTPTVEVKLGIQTASTGAAVWKFVAFTKVV